MKVRSVHLNNFRGFVGASAIELGQVTVLIGANNVGKSSILKALHLLQINSQVGPDDVWVGANEALTRIELEGFEIEVSGRRSNVNAVSCTISKGGAAKCSAILENGDTAQFNGFLDRYPDHAIIPFLSRRKSEGYHEQINAQFSRAVTPFLNHLPSKLVRIMNPSFHAHDAYKKACEEILGFPLFVIPSDAGLKVGMPVGDDEYISINQMGEGVAHIVGLLADLVISKNKIFLIEELENDLHPKSLKALLDLIVDSASSNQFVVTTHSNIVVRHLASLPDSKLYNVSATPGLMPLQSEIHEVEKSLGARLKVLGDLGYSFSDFDLWDGWVILEESSAERIIRDYLVRWFAPRLSRVRFVASRGVDEVEPNFNDFRRLVLFTHLEAAYKGKVWVRIDGDQKGVEVISALRKNYPDWGVEQFGWFDKPQFEWYYPTEFKEQIQAALGKSDKQERRRKKKELLDNVIAWIDEDEDRGKEALLLSAAFVVNELKKIEALLYSQ